MAYLDALKLLLVAVIIAGHGALAYGDLESAWPYQDIQEVQLAPVSNVTLSALVIPAVLFAMGLFFLISGLVTPGSLARKGPRNLRPGPPHPTRRASARVDAPRLARGDLGVAPGGRRFGVVLDRAGGHDEPILDTGPM